MNRVALNIALTVALVAGALLLWHYRDRDDDTVTSVPRSDYVLRDFELVMLDSSGAEAFTVRGPYLQRDVGGRSLSLVQPRFAFPEKEGEGVWNARADSAWVSPGADQVHLIDAVDVVGPEGVPGVPTRFRTDRLVVLPDTDELRSEDRVTVTQGDSILAGTGLRADMKAKRFQLLNQVTARYVPR